MSTRYLKHERVDHRSVERQRWDERAKRGFPKREHKGRIDGEHGARVWSCTCGESAGPFATLNDAYQNFDQHERS